MKNDSESNTGSKRTSKYFKVDTDTNIVSGFGTTDKKNADIIYFNFKCDISPVGRQKSYATDSCRIKSMFKGMFDRVVNQNDFFDRGKYILDLSFSEKNIKFGRWSKVSADLYVKTSKSVNISNGSSELEDACRKMAVGMDEIISKNTCFSY